MAEENTAPSSNSGEGTKAAPKAKVAPKAEAEPKAAKEKSPKLEEKPFAEFMAQHFVPELEKALGQGPWKGMKLSFGKTPIAVQGSEANEEYWQVKGQQATGDDRQFNIVFAKEDISGPKFFYCTQGSSPASTMEQFMGDERRVTLELMLLYTLQRLNGQKWLARN